MQLPPTLDTPQFRQAWADWVQHRKEIKCKLTPLATQKQIRQLVDWGHDKAIAAIEQSIRNGWRGLFEPKMQAKQPQRFCYTDEHGITHNDRPKRSGASFDDSIFHESI